MFGWDSENACEDSGKNRKWVGKPIKWLKHVLDETDKLINFMIEFINNKIKIKWKKK